MWLFLLLVVVVVGRGRGTGGVRGVGGVYVGVGSIHLSTHPL